MSERSTPLPNRNLDILRAIAVLSVLVDHLFVTPFRQPLPFFGPFSLGRFGVLLFFVHTSLVLMSSLERQGTDRPDWVRAFYIRRAFRIYPLAWVAISVAVAFSIPRLCDAVSQPVLPTVRTLASNFALVQNLTADPSVIEILWSLPIEIQMYVLLPLCFLIANRRTRDVTAMLAVLVVAGLIPNDVPVKGLWRLSLFTFGPCFGGGVLAYHLMRRGIRPVLPPWVLPLVIAAAGMIFAISRPSTADPEKGWFPALLVGASLPLIKNASANWITAAAHKVCDVSYGIYLFHGPALWVSFVVLHILPMAAQWCIFAALVVVVPVLTYRYIEIPGIKLGQAIAQTRIPTVVEVAAS